MSAECETDGDETQLAGSMLRSGGRARWMEQRYLDLGLQLLECLLEIHLQLAPGAGKLLPAISELPYHLLIEGSNPVCSFSLTTFKCSNLLFNLAVNY